eukprot:scaffold305247_cov14-Prasinocladus_malaysianus.AAC.1
MDRSFVYLLSQQSVGQSIHSSNEQSTNGPLMNPSTNHKKCATDNEANEQYYKLGVKSAGVSSL